MDSGSDEQKNISIRSNHVDNAKQTVISAADKWLARNRSLVLRQTPVWAQSFAVLLVSLGTFAVAGASIFKIDEVVTVQGQLEAQEGITEVKSPVSGKISSVFFKDGELVARGQTLVVFDTRQAIKQKSTLERLIEVEKRDLKNKINLLNDKKEVLMQKLSTSNEITLQLEKLVEEGGFQRVQYLQQLDTVYELNSNIKAVDLEIRRVNLESEKALGQMLNQLSQVDLQIQYQQIEAPVDGIIFEPKAAIDSVIREGERILTIVPQKGLRAQVYVPNKDIGFVKPGQAARIRVDAFPYSRYGELSGEVTQIGANSLEPDAINNYYRFPIKVNIDKPYLETKEVRIPLRSGMAITVNMKLREKRVISLLSDLLVDQTDSIRSIRQQ